MVVTVGIGVMIALVGGYAPEGITRFEDFSPTMPSAFPILVEDGDCRSTATLDDINGLDNGAVIVAFQHGIGPDGHVFFNGDRPCVRNPRTVFRNSAVIDGCTFGSAGDAHGLCFIIGACSWGEGRCCHGRCGRRDAFGLYEKVEVEVVTAVAEVVGMVGTEVVVAIQCEVSQFIIHIGNKETGVVWNHGLVVCGSKFNSPFCIVAACGEVGAARIANQLACCIGEGVAVGRFSNNPVVVTLFISDGGGQNLIAFIGG